MAARHKQTRKPTSSRLRKRRLAQERANSLHFESLESRQLLAGVTVGNALDVVNAPDLTSITALVNDDGGDGISLREAIVASNNTGGADTISFGSLFDTSQTILLTGGELPITDALTINGSGQELLTIDAQQNSRVLNFSASTSDLTLSGLTLTGGLITGPIDDGGGVLFSSNGQLTLDQSTVSGNSSGDNGGGIFTATGTVTLNSSTVSGNSTGDNGGGIATSIGAVTLNSSTVSDNSSGGDGGGIVTGGALGTGSGAVTLNSSTVSGNNSGGDGGGDGGGIGTNFGAVTLTSSTVSGNSATGYGADGGDGGGIWTYYGGVTITDSTVSGNRSSDNGGGISTLVGDVTLTDSTVSGNSSYDFGGGIYTDSGVTLINSTVSGNSSRHGGGISTSFFKYFGFGGSVTLISSTVSGNSSLRNGGGINTSGFTPVTIQNSIVAGNMAGGSGPDLFRGLGFTPDIDFSLIGDNTGTTLAEAQTADANGNLIGSAAGGGIIDPLLGPLANNGGPTQTHALLAGSPAIDAGNTTLITDQRGLTRPFDFPAIANAIGGNGSDIGAFELQEETPGLVVTVATDVVDPLDFETSLREAIAFANSNPGADTITFGSLFDTSQTILLTGGELSISDALTITGSDPGAPGLTINAQQNSRVLNFTAFTSDLTLNGLTLTGGLITGPSDDGGGIRFASNGMLTLNSSTVSGNSTTGNSAEGGGIRTFSGDVTLNSSTVSGNNTTASFAHGGGIFTNSGDVTLTNSTVSGNSTTGSFANGGGIGTANGAVTLTSSTVSGNSSGAAGGGIFVFNTGTDPTVTIQNSIVAGNMASGSGPDLFFDPGSTLDVDFSLIGDNTDTTLAEAQTADANGNLIGSATGSGIIDPLLGPLANNGGPTQTHAILLGSPAIDAGNTTLITDQRGLTRPFDIAAIANAIGGNGSDIGAFELQEEAPSLVVTVATDVVDTLDFETSLREAIAFANSNPGADTITFGSLFDTSQTILLTGGELSISDALTIIGSGQGLFSIDAQQNSRVLNFTVSTGDLTLSGLTLTGGQTTGPVDHGGGIRFASGDTLTLISSTVSGNSATGNIADGGGIWTLSGDVTLISSTVSGNSTGDNGDGGGIYTFSGDVTLTSSTVSGNSSGNNGGGIFTNISGDVTLTSSTISGNSGGGDGGGIYTDFGDVALTSSTVSGNSSGDAGGGIFVRNSGVNPPVTIQNSIVAGNMAGGSGPDLFLDPESTVDVDFSLIGDNTGSNFEGSTLAEAQTADANGNLIGNATGGGIIDPLLGPLAGNGGPTQTHALLAGSPAIDAGSSSELFDQRGFPLFVRSFDDPDVTGAGPDIGAFERQTVSLVVDTTSDVSDGDFSTGQFSLREAIAVANSIPGADTITFGSMFDTSQTILLTGGELFISDALTITGSGPGAPGLTIDAQQQSRVLHFTDSTGDLTLSGLTLTGGLTTAFDTSGSGIRFISSGTLTLNSSTVSGNSGTGNGAQGGGIYTFSGAVTLNISTVSGNSSGGRAGGIYTNSGAVTLTSSTVSGNSTTGSNADGGGIFTVFGNVTLNSSTVSGNSSGAAGGGIFVFDTNANPTATIQNSIVAGNMASGSGSDLFLDPDSALDIDFSLIGDNTGTTLAEAQTADANGNLIGSSTGSGIIDPLLGGLADNGGPTQTHALLPGSPAIDAGDPSAVAGQNGIPEFDQRGVGFDRVVGGRIDIGAFELQQVPPGCDFDGDFDCDIDDIDAMVMEIAAGTNNTAFDVTGDGNVDLADRDQWLADAGALNLTSGNAYLLGDANLDGTVNGQDFLIWNSNKFQSTGKWSQADWNADGTTDGQDFLIWNSNKFQSADVPVPSLVLGRPASHRVRDTALLSLFRSPSEEDEAAIDRLGRGDAKLSHQFLG